VGERLNSSWGACDKLAKTLIIIHHMTYNQMHRRRLLNFFKFFKFLILIYFLLPTIDLENVFGNRDEK
jgi:hypothetical protein